jgi:hypothetical protein
MDSISTLLGLESGQLTFLIVVVIVLVIGLFFARVAFKLTASLMRIGCFAVFFIAAAVFLIMLFV